MPDGDVRPGEWTAVRVARPTRDLDRAVAFYRDLLGLELTGSFRDHDGYDGAFFALPGGAELEITAGSARAGGGTAEDLLVLYVATAEGAAGVAALLTGEGVRSVAAENPYWAQWGHTFLDPDGYRLVIAARDDADDGRAPVQIDWYDGPRENLRTLFEYAEDSVAQLDAYLHLGRVLVARRNSELIGHLQLVAGATPDEIELKNMAVVPAERGSGVGRALVEEALRCCADEGITRAVVSTATADVGTLRFYQRLGFRFSRVTRDAFVPGTGYPDQIYIDDVPLRDQVWLDADLSGRAR